MEKRTQTIEWTNLWMNTAMNKKQRLNKLTKEQTIKWTNLQINKPKKEQSNERTNQCMNTKKGQINEWTSQGMENLTNQQINISTDKQKMNNQVHNERTNRLMNTPINEQINE